MDGVLNWRLHSRCLKYRSMITSNIRPVELADIPAIAALRRRAFKHTAATSDHDLQTALRTVLFDNPWRTDIAGFIYEREGAVAGFVGTVPRPMRFRKQLIRGVVWTQLMTEPSLRRLGIARDLLGALLTLSADLILADAVSTPALHLWSSLGGAVNPLSRFSWSIQLMRASDIGRSVAGWTGETIGRSVDALVQRLHRRSRAPLPEGETAKLDTRLAAKNFGDFIGDDVIRAHYDYSSLAWLRERLTQKFGPMAEHARSVHFSDGRLAGWYIFVLRERTAIVYQLVSSPANKALVLDHLLRDARAAGAFSVLGRLDVNEADVLVSRGASFRMTGNGVAVRTRDRELLNVALAGRTHFGGLIGEWWMHF